MKPKWDGLNKILVLKCLHRIRDIFAAFQILFCIFFFKQEIKWRKLLNIFCGTQKYYFVIFLYLNYCFIYLSFFFFFFLQKFICTPWIQGCSTSQNSTLTIKTLFSGCLTLPQRWTIQRWFDVVQRCKLQRWYTKHCFNVDLTLLDIMTSYQQQHWNVKQLR